MKQLSFRGVIDNTSVLIVTRNRSRLLTVCLQALTKQQLHPDEIIIVDNGSTDGTREVCQKFKSLLPIQYVFERKASIPHARNVAANHASGDLFVFLDDDCIPQTDWMNIIVKTFMKHDQVDVLLGWSRNYYCHNLYAQICQSYYQRWFLENNLEGRNLSVITNERTFFDTRNMTIRKKLWKKYQLAFNEASPFKKEDILFGVSLKQHSVNIVFQPKAIISHHNPHTLRDLLQTNYLHGQTTEALYQQYQISTNVGLSITVYYKWVKFCFRESLKERSIMFFCSYWLVLLLYPISFRLGRYSYRFTTKFLLK